MLRKSQIRKSSFYLVMMMFAITAYIFLVFFFPKFLDYYVETGQELSSIQKILLDLVSAKYIIAPFLFLGFISAFIWFIHSSIHARDIHIPNNNSNPNFSENKD